MTDTTNLVSFQEAVAAKVAACNADLLGGKSSTEK